MTGPSHLLNENGDLSFSLQFSKKCLEEIIQGKFQKNSSVTFIFEESPQGCHFVSFVMEIYGASFKNTALIFPEISFIQFLPLFSCSIMITDLICIIKNINISKTKKDISKIKTPFFCISRNYFFYVHFKASAIFHMLLATIYFIIFVHWHYRT